jgi:hypothetical protein
VCVCVFGGGEGGLGRGVPLVQRHMVGFGARALLPELTEYSSESSASSP